MSTPQAPTTVPSKKPSMTESFNAGVKNAFRSGATLESVFGIETYSADAKKAPRVAGGETSVEPSISGLAKGMELTNSILGQINSTIAISNDILTQQLAVQKKSNAYLKDILNEIKKGIGTGSGGPNVPLPIPDRGGGTKPGSTGQKPGGSSPKSGGGTATPKGTGLPSGTGATGWAGKIGSVLKGVGGGLASLGLYEAGKWAIDKTMPITPEQENYHSMGSTIGRLWNDITGRGNSASAQSATPNVSGGSQQTQQPQRSRSSSSGNVGGSAGGGRYSQLLSFIAKGEGGYNSMNQGTSGGRIVGSTHNASAYLGKNLTEMTVGEIMDAQSRRPGDPQRLFAAGRYQIIPSTMREAVRAAGISRDAVFNAETQDKLGIALLTGGKRPKLAAYLKGQSNDLHGAMKDLALEWASVPHPDTGRSAYGSGNKSSHSLESVKAALMQARGDGSGGDATPTSASSSASASPAGSSTPTPTLASASGSSDPMGSSTGVGSDATPQTAGSSSLPTTPGGIAGGGQQSYTNKQESSGGQQGAGQQGDGQQPSGDLNFRSGVNQSIQNGIKQKVSQIEAAFGSKLTITSGYRDPARNKKVGGAKNSAHMRGNAVDISFGGGIPATLKLIETASKAGIGGIGVYGPGSVHLDTENRRAWGKGFRRGGVPDWAEAAIRAHETGKWGEYDASAKGGGKAGGAGTEGGQQGGRPAGGAGEGAEGGAAGSRTSGGKGGQQGGTLAGGAGTTPAAGAAGAGAGKISKDDVRAAWEKYNESGNPADFVRADALMRQYQSQGGDATPQREAARQAARAGGRTGGRTGGKAGGAGVPLPPQRPVGFGYDSDLISGELSARNQQEKDALRQGMQESAIKESLGPFTPGNIASREQKAKDFMAERDILRAGKVGDQPFAPVLPSQLEAQIMTGKFENAALGIEPSSAGLAPIQPKVPLIQTDTSRPASQIQQSVSPTSYQPPDQQFRNDNVQPQSGFPMSVDPTFPIAKAQVSLDPSNGDNSLASAFAQTVRN